MRRPCVRFTVRWVMVGGVIAGLALTVLAANARRPGRPLTDEEDASALARMMAEDPEMFSEIGRRVTPREVVESARVDVRGRTYSVDLDGLGCQYEYQGALSRRDGA